MLTVDVADTTLGLPLAPVPNVRISRIVFLSCPDTDLTIYLDEVLDAAKDVYGCVKRGWYVITCTGLPDRGFLLFNGAHSLSELLRRYAFQDATGCVNHRSVQLEYAPDTAMCQRTWQTKICDHLRDATGVPQFYPRSGNCWYTTMLWVTFANSAVHNFVCRHLPSSLQEACKHCLHSRTAAEELRKKLWDEYRIGDNVHLPPENDGKNGCSEFVLLCATFKIPTIRYEEVDGKLCKMSESCQNHEKKRISITKPRHTSEPHFLFLRFLEGNHHQKFPAHRKMTVLNTTYELVGWYAGQSFCGHQTGAARSTRDWRHWSLSDADLHKDGIGPIHIFFEDERWKKDWWSAWKDLVHITKFGGGKFCLMGPHNFQDDSVDSGTRTNTAYHPGKNNIDFVYVPASMLAVS